MTLTDALGTSSGVVQNMTDLSFEDALKRLETIVQRLESGEASLDESITLYTEGAELRAQCEARLKAAQEKVDRIVLDAEGTATSVRPFDAG